MSVTHDRGRTARHEAGHAAALIIGGRLPKRVTADWPTRDSFGVMEVDHGDGVTPEGAADVVISILMGPLAAGEPGWPPEWPLDRDADGDEGQLAAGLRYLKVDEDGWYGLVKGARTLSKTKDFQRLTSLIARALELKDELSAADLRWLLGDELLRRFEIPTDEQERTHAA